MTCLDCIHWEPDAAASELFCDRHQEPAVKAFWLDHCLTPTTPKDAAQCPGFEPEPTPTR